MKRSNEVDVDAIFRIDELLDVDEDELPPERAAWYQEFDDPVAAGDDEDKT